MKNRWGRIGAVLLCWAFLGLALSLELYFNERAYLHSVDFIYLAIPQFGRAAMWGLVAPLILQLRAKVPLRSGRWIGGVSFHLLWSALLMTTFYLGRLVSYRYFTDDPILADFWTMAGRDFYGHNLIDIAFYWAVLAFGHGLDLQQKFKHEELKAAQLETRLIDTELKALREQLRPHFLFNTLNTVAVLVREGKSNEAVTLLAHLGALLRLSLDQHRHHETTLREEMAFLERYIAIQQARFSDRLIVEIAIEPAALDQRIPNLLLQPLVENAILHGVGPKSGPGRIEVRGRMANDCLYLEVSDDGPGLPAAPQMREGIGLANTRERLAKTYGARGRFSLSSPAGGGVTVSIELPCRP
jgi:two-component system, LytTR family, sensor kinase